jgi:Eco57I restriction-modification methylase/N-6 DNA methylase
MIRTVLEEILDWCRGAARMQVSGEGGERPFRSRLCESLLEKTLGWPFDFILSGEKYDVCLLDPQSHPVVYIETKEPGHPTTEQEYEKFFARLKHYPGLRHAFLTNGAYWERFDINAPLAGQEEIAAGDFEDVGAAETAVLFQDLPVRPKVGKRLELALSVATPAQIEDFFIPLEPTVYHDLTRPLPPGAHRHKLSRKEPHLIEAFTGFLRDYVWEFQQLLVQRFRRIRDGELGASANTVCRECFQNWCERSYLVAPQSLHTRVERTLAAEDSSATKLARLFLDLGFARDTAVAVAESIYAERKKKGGAGEKRQELLWPLYDPAIFNYATQTAHVYMARLLLYRIGEDQGLWAQKLSGQALEGILSPQEVGPRITPGTDPPVLAVIEEVRREMAGFARTMYESGEFDWWRLNHRETLREAELERAQALDEQLAIKSQSVLRGLNSYDLSGMDLDIWRDVYQHYLPEEERQQLGGFYTPQELVDLILDYAGYKETAVKLCQRSLVDLAAGSGAFVVAALQRLLHHLNDRTLSCHADLNSRDLTEWERSQRILQMAADNVRAVDIHPFAAFLTYINFLFAVLPLYALVRKQRRAFHLDAWIFSGNSLLTPGENAGQWELDLAANSRIQSGRYARERYRQMADQRFDFVVGNPPWGGILKGRLAPIFDERYKEQLAAEYRETYAGKLDIYGLFYDRGLHWLNSGGTLALISQGSFIDKEWAGPHTEHVRGEPHEIMGLRRKLAERAALRCLIDLNPFGQLFFGAMNIPCIAVFEKRPPREGESALVLLSSKKSWPKGIGKSARRAEVACMVRRCLELVEKSGEPLKQDFASAFRFPLSRLREYQGGRWLLAPKKFTIHARPDWPRVAQLLEASQGVTVGGEGCLSIYLMSEPRAQELGLEKALLHRIIKGQETTAWRPQWRGKVILYPYHPEKEGKWRPAFACHRPPVLDALDFEHWADDFERDLMRKYPQNLGRKRLFEHRRDGLEVVKYPKAAEYLLNYYDRLAGRTFEKRSIFDWGKEWYEFHRPRDATIIFGQPKIISPRLTPKLRFALDQEGIGIQDSCFCLGVSKNTKKAFDEFRKRLSRVLGRELKSATILRYLLGFLNSSYAQELLTTGHRPRPGDVFQISDEFLEELSVPVCKTKRQLQSLLAAVDGCMVARSDEAVAAAESRVNALVLALYGGH